MKYYTIREAKINKTAKTEALPVVPVQQAKENTKIDSGFLVDSESGVKNALWMNQAQERSAKRASAWERAVVWFYRWSQVLMGIFFLIAAALFLTGILAPEILDTIGKQITLYIVLGVSCIGTVVCFVINGRICEINERR